MKIWIRLRHASSRKRGSTVLLVLAMLTLLLLLGIAFSYSTRLETQASNNYAELAQARSSAVSGLPMVMPMLLSASQGLTYNFQSWNTVPQSLQKVLKSDGKNHQLSATEMASIRQAGVTVSKNKDGGLIEAPQANVEIRDLSGLVNINAIPDQATMERVVSAVLPGSNTSVKSSALMALRGDYLKSAYNRKVTAKSIDDEKDKNIDLRDPSAVLLDSLSRLQYKQGNSKVAVFTDNEINKLASFLTVFSQAPEVFNLSDTVHIPRIPLDDIEAKSTFDTLVTAFPDKKRELLLQFVANLVDFSDSDDKPTILDSNGNVVDENVAGHVGLTIGVEMTPFISEVYPDSATSLGGDDDGQFVEIVNPWNKSISLAGWTLRIGEGVSVSLSAILPAGGYLVITDNYNTPKPDAPNGKGSIVSLFGTTANGTSKLVQIDPALNLVDRNSKVSLVDPSGNMTDIFVYGATGQIDGKTSFQRNDPMVRGSVKAQATPFSASLAAVSNTQNISAATRAWEDGNSTMTKISQLFTISTGFAEQSLENSEIESIGKVYGGQLPELKIPKQTNSGATAMDDADATNLDLRLIDVFTASSLKDPEHELDLDEDNLASRNGADAYAAFREKMKRLNERSSQPKDLETSVTTAYSFGKVNVNTCSKYALLGLKLDSILGANGLPGFMEKLEGYRLTRAGQDKAPFQNISDFVEMFVPNIGRENLAVLDSVTDQLAVGSSSFEITSTNRLSAKQQEALESKEGGSRPATATARWIISTDQQPYSVVDFALVP